MDDKQVHQNESIKDGLEKFLDQQMFGLDDLPQKDIPKKDIPKKEIKTEFAYVPPRNTTENSMQRAAKADGYHRDSRNLSQSGYSKTERYRDYGLEDDDALYEETYGGNNYEEDVLSYSAKSASTRKKKPAERTKEQRASGSKKKAAQTPSSREKKKENKKERKKDKKRDGRKKKMPKWKKVLLILFFVMVALLLWWFVMVANVYQKMNYEKSDDQIEGAMKEDGVINVLLIGNDSRENGEDGRSDAMILVSISEKTKKIYMTSLLRDMYVDIPGHDGNRLNAAYSYGGPTLLCETIEQNFGIEINRYAIVNFQAFAAVVDAVGGVDLELTNEEVQWVNAYLNEYNLLEGREMTTDYLDSSLSGMLHLNGPQALAYCRNRYIGTDFGRTQRQRNVLSAIAKKLPVAMATNSSELINGLFPNLTTNMKQLEVYSLSLNMAKYLTYDMQQMAIPAEGTYQNATIRGMMVLQVDFEANKKILRQQVYGEEE